MKNQPSATGCGFSWSGLWPRGVSKEKAAIDLWLKELCPAKIDLCEWFHHDPERWSEFRKRYAAELDQKGDLLALLKHRITEGNVTFVYAAHDQEHNSAVVLRDYLLET